MNYLEKGVQYYIVDVFTKAKYGGNQLVVFLDFNDVFSKIEMQNIAREFNFSEVSFIKKQLNPNTFEVKLYTPEYEVPFAGHPVLGTAFIISKYLMGSSVDNVNLQVPLGKIQVKLNPSNDIEESLLVMQQSQPSFGPIISSKELAHGLQIDFNLLDRRFPIQQISTGLPFLIVHLVNLQALNSIRIEVQHAISFLKKMDLHKSNSPNGLSTSFFFISPETFEKTSDYSARMMSIEHEKIVEDAATGSANGCFLAYLLKYEQGNVYATVEQGFQMGRKSYIQIDGKRNDEDYQIRVGGNIVSVAHGIWHNN